MQQTPTQAELTALERRFEARMKTVSDSLDRRLLTLEAPALIEQSFTTPPNYLPNSHPEWSTMAYGTGSTTPATAGDTNRECYNWYRQTAATTTLAETAALALKRSVSGAQHTLWAANEGTDADIPRWDGVNGTFLQGGETVMWDIACPLSTDFVFPGQRFYIYFEAAIAGETVDIPSSLQLYCGFWDNTNTDWITGTAFTPTGSVYGAAGARTLEYKIHAKTDTGDEMLSTAVTVTTAPGTLTTENHVRLSFSGAPGFIYYGIYRKEGSNYYRVADIRNSIDLQFYDMVESGSTVVPVSGYPTVTGTAPRAYAITSAFDPATLSATAYTPYTMSVQVPTTYDRSATTSQWFRFGLDELMDASKDVMGVVIRRLTVSEGYGGWSRSAMDLTAASPPTSTATGAPVPGGTTGNPPGGGGGGPSCVLLDTDIRTSKGVRPIAEVEQGWKVDNYLFQLPVTGIGTGAVSEIVRVKSANGCELGGSMTHRLIRSSIDTTGVSLRHLKEGDEVLTCIDGRYEMTRITERIVERGAFVVKSLRLPNPHLFITNGFVSHNSKTDDILR